METEQLLVSLGIDPAISGMIQELLDKKTESEKAVFHLLAEKKSVEEISKRLQLSRQTVWRYRSEKYADIKELLRFGDEIAPQGASPWEQQATVLNRANIYYPSGGSVKQIKFRATQDFKIALDRLAMIEKLSVQDEMVQTMILNAKQNADFYTDMAERTLALVDDLNDSVQGGYYPADDENFDADPMVQLEKFRGDLTNYVTKAKQYRLIEEQMRTTLKWKEKKTA